MPKRPRARAFRPQATTRLNARQRLAAQRAAEARAARRARLTWIAVAAVAIVVAVALIAWGLAPAKHPESGAGLPRAVAFGRTTMPPWPAPDDPAPGIRKAALSVSPMEGSAQHFHAHLDVLVDRRQIPVPANLGVDPRRGAMSSLHTHDTSGVLHIESPDRSQRYILGQLFDEWQVHLSRDQIGGLKSGGGNTLTAYVDGRRASGDPAAIELKAHQEIALVFGPADSSFTPPSTYAFPSGT